MQYFSEADLEGLWRGDKETDGVTQPDFSEADVTAAEKETGFVLPASYLELMKIRNGGELGRSILQIRDRSGNICKSVRCEYLLGIGREGGCSILGRGGKVRDTGFMIGKWYPSSGWPHTFYFDYSECGPSGEPRVIAETGPGKARETAEAGASFAAFIKALALRAEGPAFDFGQFRKDLRAAAKSAAADVLKNHPDEKIAGFGFYTDDEGSMLALAVNTAGHLGEQPAGSPEEKEFFAYATTEWKYEGTEKDEGCDRLSRRLEEYRVFLNSDDEREAFRDAVVDACVQVLKDLRADGFFAGVFGSEPVLMVSLGGDDMPLEKYTGIIRELNG